ncbi:unnamed protein product, partial [Durusdinium trenchii]
MERHIRSNDFGLQGCYFIRRLANNLGEPQKSYALNAIDRAITFWKGPRVHRPIPLRAPWLLAEQWSRKLRKLMTSHSHQVQYFNITLQAPSTSIVFTKYPSVMDSLCNFKDIASQWAAAEAPLCACEHLRPFSRLEPSDHTQHLYINGDDITHLHTKHPAAFVSIATGSLQNKIFPPKKDIFDSLKEAFRVWTHKNRLPPMPLRILEEIWNTAWPSHSTNLQQHITHRDIVAFRKLFPHAVFHNEDKRASSLRIYCPHLYYQCLTKTFSDPAIFRTLSDDPTTIVMNTVTKLQRRFRRQYPWALGKGRDLPNAYVLPKRKKQFTQGRPIVSFVSAPFRPMLNCVAKLLYNLIALAFPHNLAKGFFTSIDTSRFVDSWYLTLRYLSSKMSTGPDEILSVNPKKGNTPGDVVKGRACRTLNVTRKIYIRDIESIITMSLQMTQFSIGNKVFEQIRGSPMGSPLSPALCLMVVALSEEVWYRTFQTTLATLDLSSRLLRYVDNRLCLVNRSWLDDPAFTTFLHPMFYGEPIVLETEPDQEFLGFCIEFNPFALRYSPPRDRSQVMVLSHCTACTEMLAFLKKTFNP